MTTTRSLIWGGAFRFRGIGDNTSDSDGTFWYFGEDGSSANSGTWKETLLRPPPGAGADATPSKASLSVSSYQIQMHNSDRVATRFQNQQIDADARLSSDIDDSQNTIPADDDTLANSVVHIGREAIKLGSYDSNNNEYTGCTRGFWGSDGLRHRQGDGLYSNVPFWRGRIVDLFFVYTEGGSTTLISPWTGVVDSISTDEPGTALQIETSEITGKLFDAEINRGNTTYPRSALEYSGAGFYSTFIDNSVDYDTKVHKSGNIENVALQVQGALMFNPVLKRGGGATQSKLGSEFDIPDELDPGNNPTDPMYEIGAYGRRIKQAADQTDGVTDPRPTKQLDYPNNPLAIAWSICVSSPTSTNVPGAFDVLNIRQALDLFDLFAGFSLDKQARVSAQVDQLLTGWDGEPVNAWELITEKLLRPYGLFWGTDGQGGVEIELYEYAGVKDYDDARDNPVEAVHDTDGALLQWDSGLGSTVDQISVKIGDERLGEQSRVTVQAENRGTSSDTSPRHPGALAPGAEWEYDFSTVEATAKRRREIEGTFVGQLIKHAAALPSITIRARADDFDGETVGIGDRILIADLLPGSDDKFIVDNDGTRVSLAGNEAQFIGLVTAKKFEPARFTYKITCKFLNYRLGDFVRWRAPSMEVDSNTDTGSDDKLYCVANSQFSFDDSDNNSFYVGDDIQLVDGTGVTQSSGYEVTSIGSDGTGDFLQIDNGSAIGDVSGQIVRLESYESYRNQQPGGFSDVELIWTYLADSSENLGSTDDAAHVYGV